jgi:hypothetical protein
MVSFDHKSSQLSVLLGSMDGGPILGNFSIFLIFGAVTVNSDLSTYSSVTGGADWGNT